MRHTGMMVLASVTTVALLGGAGIFLALGGWKVLASTVKDEASAEVGVTEIRLAGGSGSVRIGPGAASRVDVRRTVRYLRPFAQRPAATHRIDGTVLRLDTACGRFCTVDYVVTAPEGVRVAGRLSSGNVDLTSVSTVDVKTSSGAITLDDVTGDIRVRSSSGSIEGRDLRPLAVDASSSSGDVSLDLAKPASARASTSSGDVEVTVPKGGYRIDTRTSSGRTRVEVPDEPAGPYHLDLRTSSGNLTVTPR